MDLINKLEKEIEDLRKILHEKETELYQIRNEWMSSQQQSLKNISYNVEQQYNETGLKNINHVQFGEKLPKWAIERYSRQILLPDIGVCGQEKLCAGRVLIVGAGGLGCPAAVYLAGAGVGEIGIVDYDTVDVTNIHRQILHTEKDQYMNKAESAAQSLRSINSHIIVKSYNVQLDSNNALKIASNYDVILDCTDNVPTRYMLNDLCTIMKLPLVSGSALKMEGQLTVYGFRSGVTDGKDTNYKGPCYRCVFPTPPPPEAVGSCSANGVAGPVPGVIGSLQALEAIKYIVGRDQRQLLVERMLLFDGEDMTFRTVKLRPRNPECAACSDSPTISQLMDYETFCNAQAKEKRKHESRLKTELRKRQKLKRMSGQSYYGFRVSPVSGDKRKWIQDVLKQERKMGPRCKSKYCAKGNARKCSELTESDRFEVFRYFWYDLDWRGKKSYARSLIDSVPAKRRRVTHKGDVSRKGDSKLYHLFRREERMPVCRVMFLNTLGIKEAMVRCWLTTEDKPKAKKKPLKSINVDSYIDSLPRESPKCQICANGPIKFEYLKIQSIKNIYQLYTMYVRDMGVRGMVPASRKTFTKVVNARNLKIFKEKNEGDICDMVIEHNGLSSGIYVDGRQWC